MSSDVVILVPRRRDKGHRDKLWSFSRALWAELFPDWPIYEGHHEHGPFNRSAAVNRAAVAAGTWNVAIIIDSDVLPDPEGINAAVKVAREGFPASGFNRRRNLSQPGSAHIMKGYKGSWERYVASNHNMSISGAFAVSHDLWDKVGGFDELFVGWGFEDTAFEHACETVSGRELFRAETDIWHLWHAKSPEHNNRLPSFQANKERRDRYIAARFNREAMEELLVEARERNSEKRSAPRPGRATTIPRILHRTVPAKTSPESDSWWQAAGALHPGWQLMEHRDPLDPNDWPETGDLWKLCKSGAQKAGLIRLEALFRWGGIYIDSDVEVYRSFEPFLVLEGFAAWEDAHCVPDAILGFKPGHPALAIMLEKARVAVETRQGAWKSGPGVTTEVLPGREDVLLLPPGSLYPYHYKEKERRDEDHAANPWTFAAHHWAHSWKGY